MRALFFIQVAAALQQLVAGVDLLDQPVFVLPGNRVLLAVGQCGKGARTAAGPPPGAYATRLTVREGDRIFTRHGRLPPSEMTWQPCSPRGPSTGT